MRPLRLLVTAAVSSAALIPVTASAASAAPVIQPGSSITAGGAYCTLNWIYDGTGDRAGAVYAGTARHCVTHVGQRVSLASGSLGTTVEPIGRVAYRSKKLDFALIKLRSSVREQVKAAMAGHPNIPTGVARTSQTAVGDICQFSGHGVVFDTTRLTQQDRVGVLVSNTKTQHYCDGAVTPGDSGGPVADVTAGNKALGIVDTLGVGLAGLAPTVGEGGVSMPGLLADARAHGVPIRLRTVD